MLLYTSKNTRGEVEATYSGRFTFIHFKSLKEYEEAESLQRADNLRALWEQHHNTGPRVQILSHEYSHRHIFALSETGRILNGLRLVAFYRFMVLGHTKCIEEYYRMRTVYMMETMSYHEELATALDEIMAGGDLSIEASFSSLIQKRFQKDIDNAEKRITENWQELGLLPSGMLRRLCLVLGKPLNRHFAVQATLLNRRNCAVPVPFSDQGVINDMHMPRPDNTFLEKEFKRMVQPVILKYCWKTFDTKFRWYWIGQRAQFRHLRDCYQVDYQDFWKTSFLPTVYFIMEWAGIPVELQHIPIEMYEDTLTMDEDAFYSRWMPTLNLMRDFHAFEQYFDFFMLHGN